MHWIFLEYGITKQELLTDLKEVLKENDFFFIDEPNSGGIPIELLENDSYLKSRIELYIHQEEEGFRYADILAEYLSEKYKCDTVRELHHETALAEYNYEYAVHEYSVLHRRGKKYIIEDEEIDEEGFEVKIDRELKTNRGTI